MAAIFFVQTALLRCCRKIKGDPSARSGVRTESDIRRQAKEVLELAERRGRNPYLFMTEVNDRVQEALDTDGGVVAFKVHPEGVLAALKDAEVKPRGDLDLDAEDVFLYGLLFDGYAMSRGFTYLFEQDHGDGAAATTNDEAAEEEDDGSLGIGYVQRYRENLAAKRTRLDHIRVAGAAPRGGGGGGGGETRSRSKSRDGRRKRKKKKRSSSTRHRSSRSRSAKQRGKSPAKKRGSSKSSAKPRSKSRK